MLMTPAVGQQDTGVRQAHTHTHIQAHTHTHTYRHTHTHTHTGTHTYMRIGTHSHTCARKHTHTSTHAHTHTHTGHIHTHVHLLCLREWCQLTLEREVSLPASPWSARSAYLLHLGAQGQLTCFTLERKVSLPACPAWPWSARSASWRRGTAPPADLPARTASSG